MIIRILKLLLLTGVLFCVAFPTLAFANASQSCSDEVFQEFMRIVDRLSEWEHDPCSQFIPPSDPEIGKLCGQRENLRRQILTCAPRFLPMIIANLSSREENKLLKYPLLFTAISLTGAERVFVIKGASENLRSHELTDHETIYDPGFLGSGPFVIDAQDYNVEKDTIRILVQWWETFDERIADNLLVQNGDKLPYIQKYTDMEFSLKTMRLLRVVKADGICALPAILQRMNEGDNGIMFDLFWRILSVQMQNGVQPDGIQPTNPFDYESRFWEHPETLPDEKWRLEVVMRWWEKHSSNYDTLPVLKEAIEKEIGPLKEKLEKLSKEQSGTDGKPPAGK